LDINVQSHDDNQLLISKQGEQAMIEHSAELEAMRKMDLENDELTRKVLAEDKDKEKKDKEKERQEAIDEDKKMLDTIFKAQQEAFDKRKE